MLASNLDQEFTVKISRQVLSSIGDSRQKTVQVNKRARQQMQRVAQSFLVQRISRVRYLYETNVPEDT